MMQLQNNYYNVIIFMQSVEFRIFKVFQWLEAAPSNPCSDHSIPMQCCRKPPSGYNSDLPCK